MHQFKFGHEIKEAEAALRTESIGRLKICEPLVSICLMPACSQDHHMCGMHSALRGPDEGQKSLVYNVERLRLSRQLGFGSRSKQSQSQEQLAE